MGRGSLDAPEDLAEEGVLSRPALPPATVRLRSRAARGLSKELQVCRDVVHVVFSQVNEPAQGA